MLEVLTCMIWRPLPSSVLQVLAALEETGLLPALENPEAPLTVFVPNNAVRLAFFCSKGTGAHWGVLHETPDHVQSCVRQQ